MSKIETEKEALFEVVQRIDSKISKDVLDAACDYLGPTLFRKDAALVAFSSKDELSRVKENFIKKKLGIKDSDEEIDKALKSVGEAYGMSVRNKKRAVVYALLMNHYGITSLK